MRLFIAYDIPGELKGRIVALQKRIGGGDTRIKWVEPENIHLTLKFLGEVEDRKAEESG